MENKYIILLFNKVETYMNELPFPEQAKLKMAFPVLENGDFHLLNVKQLRGDIKELKIKRHRFIFFTHDQRIYFIEAFLKKTKKAPKQEIDNALEKYQKIIKLL